MSNEHKVAIEKIAGLCAKSSMPTKRIERIYDIALEALGLTANQRDFEIRQMRESAIQAKRDEMASRRQARAA